MGSSNTNLWSIFTSLCHRVNYFYKTWFPIQTANLGVNRAAIKRRTLLSALGEYVSPPHQKPQWPFGGELVCRGRTAVNWTVCSERLWVGFLWGYGHSPLGEWLGRGVYLGGTLPLTFNRSLSTWLAYGYPYTLMFFYKGFTTACFIYDLFLLGCV